MIYKIGLVGLPNVGKSSIFNLLSLKNKSISAPFPYSTIQPVKAMVNVNDIQLDKIHQLFLWWFKEHLSPSKFIKKNCSLEFIDLAGIVPLDGALEEKKSDLGASFLSHIRGVDLILLVVRSFVSDSVESELISFIEEYSHKDFFINFLREENIELYKTKKVLNQNSFFDNSGKVNFPSIENTDLLFYSELKRKEEKKEIQEIFKNLDTIGELKIVLLTLLNSDLEIIEKMIKKYSKDQVFFSKELDFLIPLREEALSKRYIPIYLLERYKSSSDWEKKFLQKLSLLTIKKIVILSNYNSSNDSLEKVRKIENWTKKNNFLFSSLNVEGEEIYSLLEREEEKIEARKSIYLKDSSVDKLISTIVSSLDLKTFYTFKLVDKKGKKYSLSNLSWNLEAVEGEVRAWFFSNSETVGEAAARIHNDLSSFFISSKIIESERFLKISTQEAFSNLINSVSKNYKLKGGEILHVISSV